MQEHSGQLVEVVEMIQDEAANYVDVKQDYELAQRFVNSNLTYSNVVSYPYVPDKKSYPIRWLIVLLSVIGTYIVTFITLSVIEKNKENDN